jgi:hypothetical protein
MNQEQFGEQVLSFFEKTATCFHHSMNCQYYPAARLSGFDIVAVPEGYDALAARCVTRAGAWL